MKKLLQNNLEAFFENNLKSKNKIYILLKIILSILFSFTLILDKILVFNESIFGKNSEIYFSKMTLVDIIAIILLSIVIYFVISIIEFLVDKIDSKIYIKTNRKKANIKIYFIIFLIILICWLPYILTFFPGGIYSDTRESISQAIGNSKLNNHHPILYALLLRIFIKIGIQISSLQLGIELFTIFQVLAMAATCAYFVYWLYKKNITKGYLILVTLFFSLFRLIPLYAISLWKDTPFCIALFLYIIYIAEIIYKDARNLENMGGIIKYIILIFLVAFLRNNGIYIVIFTTIILAFTYRKRIFNVLKEFAIISITQIIICIIIQGPIYNYYKVNTKFVENLGVLLQQVCYVIVNDGNITDNQIDFINNICEIEKIKQLYSPCIIDTIKWDESFNHNYLEEHKSEFIKVWFEIFIQNPQSYVKAYLLNTIGYWNVNKATFDAYINPKMWQNTRKLGGINQKDYIQMYCGTSIENILIPNKAISSAIFFFITLLEMLITIYKKKYKNLLIYVPAIITYITILIAVPLAFSLRYVYILVLMLPLTLIIPFLKQES